MVQALAINNNPQKTLIAVPAVFLVLATAATYMRLRIRRSKNDTFGVDDYLCAAGLILTYGCYIDLVLCVVYGGLGKDITTIPSFDNIEYVFKGLTGISILWGTTVATIQAAILTLYIRLFGVKRWYRWLCLILLTLVVCWWISWFITILTTCIPLRKFWTPGLPGKCISTTKFCIGSGLSHLILDILILTSCLPIVWTIKVNLRTKFALSIVVSLGLFATISGLLRMDCLVSLIPYDEGNFTQSAWLGVLFELLENCCGIICCCMPMFPAFLKFMAGTSFATSLRSLVSNVSGSKLGILLRSVLSTTSLREDRGSRSSSEQKRTMGSSTHHLGMTNPTKNQTMTTANSVKSRGSEGDVETLTGTMTEIPANNVKVTRTWDVHQV